MMNRPWADVYFIIVFFFGVGCVCALCHSEHDMKNVIMNIAPIGLFLVLCIDFVSSCNNPLGTFSYRLGEGPAAHIKRMGQVRWQDFNAVDYLAPAGTPVYALVDGVVCDPAKDSKCVFGKTAQEMKDKHSLNSFYLNGADKKQYYYTHLQSIAVKPGDAVKKGQLVGYVGAYNGKNAHLHLGVSSGNPCDILKTCTPADTRACK